VQLNFSLSSYGSGNIKAGGRNKSFTVICSARKEELAVSLAQFEKRVFDDRMKGCAGHLQPWEKETMASKKKRIKSMLAMEEGSLSLGTSHCRAL
jgi:hypothetical protein